MKKIFSELSNDDLLNVEGGKKKRGSWGNFLEVIGDSVENISGILH